MTIPNDNIAHAFADVAEANGRLPAVIAAQEVLDYSGLWRLVQRIAARMQADGVGSGSLVAVNLQDIRLSVASLLATALLGAGFVVASPTLAKAKVLKPTHFYRTPNMAGNLSVPFRVIDVAWLGADDGAAPRFVSVDPDAAWLYLHTSGTTGIPKYLGLSQRMVWDRSVAASVDFPYRQTTFASFFAPTSRPFYARALAALMQACTIVEGIDLAQWHEAGVNFVCGSPMQVLLALGDTVIDPPFARLEISGSPLPDGAAARYLQSFRSVLDVYGASETSKSFANDMAMGANGEIVRTGIAFDSEVQIVDEKGQPCPSGVAGFVRVRNPYLAEGYVAAPEATARAFRDGWFYPGDFARWGPRRELMVLGRDDAILNIGGYKISSALLEVLTKTVSGVNDVVCLQNPIPGAAHPVIVLLVLAPRIDRENTIEQVMCVVAERLGHVFARKNLRVIDKIPVDADGQHDRKACQALVLSYARAGGEME